MENEKIEPNFINIGDMRVGDIYVDVDRMPPECAINIIAGMKTYLIGNKSIDYVKKRYINNWKDQLKDTFKTPECIKEITKKTTNEIEKEKL